MGWTEKRERKQAGFITQCVVLTRRSWVNMFRDLGYYWFRFVIYIALSLCLGTVFYHIGSTPSSIQARATMLAFISSFMTFMAIGGFPSFVEDMKIFTRERLNGHYGVAAFVVGNTLSSVPFIFLISVPPGALAYYLVGLQKSPNHFAYFALLLFSSMLLVESLMMAVAAVVPDFLMGIITGAGILGIMILNNGFFRLPNDIPKLFWKYPIYYISLHKYVNQGLYKNEFEGLTFPNGWNSSIGGDEILRNVWEMEIGESKWIDFIVIIGMMFGYRVLFWCIVKSAEKVKPVIRALLGKLTKQRTDVEDP